MIVEVLTADAIIQIHPTNTLPVSQVIANFAQRVGVEQWYAVVFANRIVIVYEIEEPLS